MKIDINSFIDSIRRIEYAISRIGIVHFDGYALQKIKEAYDIRVFEKLEGSLGQGIGLPPTPMHETGDLRQFFAVTRDGLDVLDYGFWLEGLDDVANTEGVTDIGQLENELYERSVTNRQLVFGPIWDITDDEAESLEEEAERMFYKLYDGWL